MDLAPQTITDPHLVCHTCSGWTCSGGNLWLHGAPSTGPARSPFPMVWSETSTPAGVTLYLIPIPVLLMGRRPSMALSSSPIEWQGFLKKNLYGRFFCIFRLKRKHILNKQVLHEKIKLVLGKYVCLSISCFSSCWALFASYRVWQWFGWTCTIRIRLFFLFQD